MSADLKADRRQIERFVETLFRHADERTLISMRAFRDDADGVWRYPDWPVVAVNGSLERVVDTAEDFASQCAAAVHAIVFAAPLATFRNNKATEADLANGLAISLELDQQPGQAQAIL